VFGPQTLHRLPELLEARRATQRPSIDVSFPEIEKFDALPAPRAEGPTAFVSIMEGCSKYCTFCIVPYTRGEEISRPLDDVLAEVDSLVAQGVREVTLLGQNVNAYAGAMSGGGNCDLALLIHILARFEGLGRIRYTTSHPAHFTDALIDAYGTEPKLAAVLHLPVQSGSDRILAMMKRGYTKADYLAKIRRLRALKPGISLSTDLIVGFPSESDADFEETMDLIEQARIDFAYSFVYSPRPGTPAANLRDGVPADVKQARLERLQKRVNEIGQEYAAGLVGSTQRVLVEGPSRRGNGQLTGKTECNRSINFDGPERLRGEFVDVRVTRSLTNSLRGEVVTAAV
jgi:tRNA-2-methylthio-N6-dimethylallyladenosine synthase